MPKRVSSERGVGLIRCHKCGQEVLRVRHLGARRAEYVLLDAKPEVAYRVFGKNKQPEPFAVRGDLYQKHRCRS